jgi:hypothetical protein
MGASTSMFTNKKIYISYDNRCKNPKIQGICNAILRLPIEFYLNKHMQSNECDLLIHLIDDNTSKCFNQLRSINDNINRKSMFIYMNSNVPGNKTSYILSTHPSSISVSYLNNDFDQLCQIIISKLTS